MQKGTRLLDDDAQKVRDIIKLVGVDAAAKRFGLEVRTLTKAACGGSVHKLTVSVIVGRLEVL